MPLAAVAEMGVKGLEVSWKDGMTSEQVRKAIEPHGLRVTTVCAEGGIGQDDFAATAETYAARAAALDCRFLFWSVKPDPLSMEEGYERLKRIGDIVAARNVTVAMETHPPYGTNGDVGLKTMRAVNHPNIRVNFDTANIYYYNQNVATVEELKKEAKYVAAVHLKDTMGGYRDARFPVFGEGAVDFAGIFRVLDGVGFDGPLTMEMEGDLYGPKNLEERIEHTRKSAKHILGLWE